MLKYSALLSLVFTAGLGSSAQADPIPDYTFKISNEAGKPFVITWRDGREAALQRSEIEGTVTIPMGVADNSCNAVIPKDCAFSFPMKKVFTALVWTKHPTADHIGKPLRRVFRSKNTVNGVETESVSYYTFLTRSALFDDVTPTYAPEYALATKATLSCDRMDWMTFDATGNAQVAAWMSQSMVTNPETGLSENQLTTDFTRSKFHKIDDTHVELTTVGKTSRRGNIDNDPRIITSDFMMWAMKDGTGICPVTLGLDITAANKPGNARFFSNSPPADLPYAPFDYTPNKLLTDAYADVIQNLTNSSVNRIYNSDGTSTSTITYAATENEID